MAKMRCKNLSTAGASSRRRSLFKLSERLNVLHRYLEDPMDGQSRLISSQISYHSLAGAKMT